MFCQRCGKKLEEGEVCSCVLNLVNNNQSDQGVQNVQGIQSGLSAQGGQDVRNEAVSPPVQPSDGVPMQSVNSLPESKALADAAKNAAKNIKNNFIVNEILCSIKDALISPVKLVQNSAQRTDILWLILFVIDAFVIALSSNILFEFNLFAVFNAFELTEEFSDFMDRMVELGYDSSELLTMNLLTISLTIVSAIILTAMLLAVCRKDVNLAAIANVVMSMFTTGAVLMLISVGLSVLYLPAGLMAASVVMMTVILLGYEGILSLGDFEKVPLWLYIIATVVVLVVFGYMTREFVFGYLSELAESIMSEVLEKILYSLFLG